MKFRFATTAVVALVWAAPAYADMTAHYVGLEGEPMMTVEIAGNGNGDLRITFGDDPNYFLTHDGQDYLVKINTAGPTVMRQDDINTALIEQWNPKIRELTRKSRRDMRLVANGIVSIRGRKGMSYVPPNDGGSGLAGEPLLVVSDDPTLAPLAAAMQRQFNASFGTMRILYGDASPWNGMTGIFGKGAPLSFLGMRLDTIDRASVPVSRFVLPATPISREAVKRDLASMP